MSATDVRRFLRPEVLSRIGGLELRARLVVEGFYTGMHRSPYHGLSVEYADHRPYSQGDDYRHIDWKVFARTDKHYIKQYEQETNLECMILVDASESMTYRSDRAPMSKYEYGSLAAAALAYLALNRQRDSVGLAIFDERINRFLRPSRSPGHWKTIVHELQRGCGPAKTGLRTVLDDLAERLDHRMLVVLISDLLDDELAILRGLNHLRHRRNEIIVFCVMDDAERDFPFQGPTMFAGLEGQGQLLTEPRSLRDRYQAELHRFQETLRKGCNRMHIDLSTFATSSPLDGTLSGYLATRSARIRQRSSRVMGRR